MAAAHRHRNCSARRHLRVCEAASGVESVNALVRQLNEQVGRARYAMCL